MGMKGFIEIHLNGKARMISINQIESFQIDSIEDWNIKSSIDVYSGSCIYCDESYDEIKQKIEEAQPFDPWNLSSAWQKPFIHPNTEGSKSDE